MEQNLQRRVVGLKDKLPDIRKTLDTVQFLKARRVCRPTPNRTLFIFGLLSNSFVSGVKQGDDDPIETTFELNDTLYAKAEVPPTEEVYLWLGANVMLAYPIDEAEELLESKLKAAKTSLANCEEDLDFLREQVTVSFTFSGGDRGEILC
jgi:hypothetical protein